MSVRGWAVGVEEAEVVMVVVVVRDGGGGKGGGGESRGSGPAL
jgi:hypothetical protein